MSFDPENIIPPGARIKVIGVGGGGGNAVNTMIKSSLEGVDFIAANTDVQSLRFSLASNKIQLGRELTKGLGAGADPDIGRDAALEDREGLVRILDGADMVFITAGMGGGTGTGGASVISQIAREQGALTVAVVTKPFLFEGKRRRRNAEEGIARLRESVDTLITIPNQRLLQVATPDLSMIDAFKMADDVLVNAVRGISDIINIPGIVNVDFADVKTVMASMGQALMGIGVAEGENRAIIAAKQAICSPLLEDINIEGATGILINITAGSNISLMEVNEACSIVQEAAHEDANIIIGAVIDEDVGDSIRVTVIATGFPLDDEDKDVIESIKLRSQELTPRRSVVATGPIATRPTSGRPAFSPLPPPAAPTRAEPVDTMQTKPIAAVIETPRTPAQQDQAAALMANSESEDPPIEHFDEMAQALTDLTLEGDLSSMEEASDDSAQVQYASSYAPPMVEEPAFETFIEPPPLGMANDERRMESRPGASLAESLFGDEAELDELPRSEFQGATVAPLDDTDDQLDTDPSGEAPLDSLFDDADELTFDIDRKIDEALELAEKIRQPDHEEDDLDIPTFLRNNMKDLPM